MNNITPHMYSAGALVLIAIYCTYAGILSSTQDVEITNTKYLREPNQANLETLDSDKVLNALVKEPKRLYQNPFVEPQLREGGDITAQLDIKVPKPPAPKLRMPVPPALPLPGDQ